MSEKHAIFLDSNAGAPLRREVVEALLAQIQDPEWFPANPSSAHAHGRRARRSLSYARESIAASLGAGVDPDSLLLTSSGTEANQSAIQFVLLPLLDAGIAPHWVVSAGEHESILQWVPWMEKRGGSVTILPLDTAGRIRTSGLLEVLRPETALVTLGWANNETGVVCEDLSRIALLLRGRGIRFHVDGAQAWGKIPVDLTALGADLVAFSGHKIGAPAGTGILWSARGLVVRSPLSGKQNEGRRGGTENILGMIALGAAAASLDAAGWACETGASRERIEQKVLAGISGARVHGSGATRLANTSNFGFDGIESAGLTAALDLAGFSVSSGAACSSGVEEPSHVLQAMGLAPGPARAAIRVSLFSSLPAATEDRFVKALSEAVAKMRAVR